jgi:peroxiredoxin
MLGVGDQAPEFILASDEDKQISLKDYKGKCLLLYFYPARLAAPWKPANFAIYITNSQKRIPSCLASARTPKKP